MSTDFFQSTTNAKTQQNITTNSTLISTRHKSVQSVPYSFRAPYAFFSPMLCKVFSGNNTKPPNSSVTLLREPLVSALPTGHIDCCSTTYCPLICTDKHLQSCIKKWICFWGEWWDIFNLEQLVLLACSKYSPTTVVLAHNWRSRLSMPLFSATSKYP